jgi:DNA-binding CsgD family transcriptional regulator
MTADDGTATPPGRAVLAARVDAVLASTRPDGPAVDAGILHALRHAEAAPSGLGGGERARYAAAVVLAQARRGALDAAMQTAEDALEFAAERDDVELSVIGELAAAASEAYATAGQPWRCVTLALEALNDAEDDAATYRAHTLLAIGHALNGEYDAADIAIAACARLAAEHGWGVSAAAYPLLLGEILVASARLDHGRLREIAAAMAAVFPDDTVWHITGVAAEAMALLTEGDAGRAIPLLLTVMNGANQPDTLMMVRGFATGLYADLLLARGEPRRVLTMLEGRESPPGHALCVDMQRAAAYLLIGDPRRALTTTDACMRIGTEHCLRTIPPILLRRAIAHDRLGHEQRADEDFEAAFHMLSRSRSLTPMLTLSPAELRGLLDRLDGRRPDLGDTVREFRARLDMLPPVDVERAVLPHLTDRETRLARHLRAEATFAELATELHVSLHTLKSQSRSLYAKLGVRSREEAITVLERAGFFD